VTEPARQTEEVSSEGVPGVQTNRQPLDWKFLNCPASSKNFPAIGHSNGLEASTPDQPPYNEPLQNPIAEQAILKANHLARRCSKLVSPVLAFSGGIDSALVAAFLFRFSSHPLAVTALSPSLSQRQKGFAIETAAQIGIAHRWVDTQEHLTPGYRSNRPDRCYHCKENLYQNLHSISKGFPTSQLISGTNLDDLKDYRPGLQAAKEFSVLQPLAECRITKKEVRIIAAFLGLVLPDRPASPCLASRIAYGVQVTPERLKMIEKAEEILWKAGFSDVRVRMMDGAAAKIEVPKKEIPKLECPSFLDPFSKELHNIGFQHIKVDPNGLRSGNLNDLLQLSVKKPKPADFGPSQSSC